MSSQQVPATRGGKRICNVCGASRWTMMVVDLPCLTEDCSGWMVAEMTISIVEENSTQPKKINGHNHNVMVMASTDDSGSRVITASFADAAEVNLYDRILSMLDARARTLDFAGFRAGGDLIRSVIDEIVVEFGGS
jgi:hypothetical protein